jgi:hypothetical protein
MEPGWYNFKDEIAWLQCPDLDRPQTSVGDLVQADEAPTLQALTGYTSLVAAITAFCS